MSNSRTSSPIAYNNKNELVAHLPLVANAPFLEGVPLLPQDETMYLLSTKANMDRLLSELPKQEEDVEKLAEKEYDKDDDFKVNNSTVEGIMKNVAIDFYKRGYKAASQEQKYSNVLTERIAYYQERIRAWRSGGSPGIYTTPAFASTPISLMIKRIKCSNKSPLSFLAAFDLPPSIPSSAAPIDCCIV